ncbi:RIP metalloprotease RseP [Arenibacterium sp. CAU 1754]
MDILSLIPQFGGVVQMVLAFVVSLSVIVAVHEYGHYIVGRWSGIHAEVFSLGFGPVLFSRQDRHGTRWQIAALPFGGFVKFLGDSNAASGKDSETMDEAAQDPVQLRRTMHGAPLWARAATVAAGPMFNFAMSIIVFTGIFMFRGAISDPLAVGDIQPLPGGAYELQAGDEILSVGGIKMPKFNEESESVDWQVFRESLPRQETLEYVVRRGEAEVSVSGPFLYPPRVDSVAPRSAAYTAGLESGDVIVGVDGAPIYAFDALKDIVESSNGRALDLEVWRAGETLKVTLKPRETDEPQEAGGFAKKWRIGVVSGMAFEPAYSTTGPVDAFIGGLYQTYRVITRSLSGLWHMATGAISTCNMSGPIGIAQTSGAMASQGTQSFVFFIAVLSTAVGLLNLFPVPALDGGHLVFYAYEAVTGKPPNEKVLGILMTIGIAAILSLMGFALFNDIFC